MIGEPQATNGEAVVKTNLALIIAVTIMVCIAGEAAVAGVVARYGASDWTIVSTIASGINSLALVLAGALAVLAKPTGDK